MQRYLIRIFLAGLLILQTSSGVLAETSSSDTGVEEDVFDSFAGDEFETPAAAKPGDPLRGWNRAMFQFNDKLYFWFLKPVARGYRFVVPGLIRTSIKNIFDNLEFPIRFVNSLLQAKGRKTQVEFAKFALNTTIGIGGIFNPAAHFPELQADDEDLGQTLGIWGIGNGWYVIWPFFGPSTIRDTAGKVGDGFMDPLAYLDSLEVYEAVTVFKKVNEISFRIGDYETLIGSSIEPYEAMRDFYLKYRENKINK
jgi:phospholipid-binding lipoprotein MlaA